MSLSSYASVRLVETALLMRHTAKQERLQKSKSATGFKRPKRIWWASWILHVLVIFLKLQRLVEINVRSADVPRKRVSEHRKHISRYKLAWIKMHLWGARGLVFCLVLMGFNELRITRVYKSWNVLGKCHNRIAPTGNSSECFETFAWVLIRDLFCLLD